MLTPRVPPPPLLSSHKTPMPFRLPAPDNAIIGMNVPFHRFPAAKTKIMTMDEVEVFNGQKGEWWDW